MSRYAMIALGGALGSLARFQVAGMIQARTAPGGFPWGTFIVNVSGCFVMGIVAALLTDRFNPQWRYLVPIGFLGAYTTFSTFALETYWATTAGALVLAGAYVAGSVLAGYVALAVGVMIGRQLLAAL